MLYLIFHPQYLKYNFGPGHPFWPKRAEQFLKTLKYQIPDTKYQIVEPKKATDEDILLMHSENYLERVKRLAKDGGNLSIDTPVNPDVLEAAYYSVGGSILACGLALEGKKAVNLLGGLHHAGPSTSSGFCIFNDHAIAIKKLQKQGLIKKAMIYDLDVHAGNGTQEIFYSDPAVFHISIHQDPTFFYPGTGFSWQKGEGEGKGFNLNIPLPAGTGEKEYLGALDNVLPLYDQFKPNLVVLVLGVDTYKGDPLAGFQLEKETYTKIGERFKKFKNFAIMFAGGYSKEVPKLWLAFLEGLV